MEEKKMLTNVAGTFLIQADASFLNGAGLGEGEDRNVTIPKTFQDGKDRVPYVSSQAWKRWLRNTLIEETVWPKSELRAIGINEKGNTDKISGELNPVDFAEDDIFGYMKTAKSQGKDKSEQDVEEKSEEEKERERQVKIFKKIKIDITAIQKGKEGKGKKEKELSADDKTKRAKEIINELKEEMNERLSKDGDAFEEAFQKEIKDLTEPNSIDDLNKEWFTKINRYLKEFDPGRIKAIMRNSPFAASLLVSIRRGNKQTSRDEGFVHLKEGTPQPYTTEFYNAHLQGVFSLCYDRLGIFSNIGDRIELDEQKVEKYLKENKIKIKEDLGDKGKVYEVVKNERKERAGELLKALALLRGGAKQAQFGTDVSPKAIILAGLTCGNPIFNHLFTDAKEGPELKIDTLKEVIKDYADRITTPVYIGIRKGYLKNEAEVYALNNTNESDISIKVMTPIEAANAMAGELK